MALDIEDLRSAAQGAMWISPARIGLTAEDEICEDTDVRCVKLLVGAGGSIPATVAARYGLIADASPAVLLAEAATVIATEGDAPTVADEPDTITDTSTDEPADQASADTDDAPEVVKEEKPKRRR